MARRRCQCGHLETVHNRWLCTRCECRDFRVGISACSCGGYGPNHAPSCRYLVRLGPALEGYSRGMPTPKDTPPERPPSTPKPEPLPPDTEDMNDAARAEMARRKGA